MFTITKTSFISNQNPPSPSFIEMLLILRLRGKERKDIYLSAGQEFY